VVKDKIVQTDKNFAKNVLDAFGVKGSSKNKFPEYIPELYGILPDGTRVIAFNEFTDPDTFVESFYSGWQLKENEYEFKFSKKYQDYFYSHSRHDLIVNFGYWTQERLKAEGMKSGTEEFKKLYIDKLYRQYKTFECHKLMLLSYTNHFGFMHHGEEPLIIGDSKRNEIYRTAIIIAHFQASISTNIGIEDKGHRLFHRYKTPFNKMSNWFYGSMDQEHYPIKKSDKEMDEFYIEDCGAEYKDKDITKILYSTDKLDIVEENGEELIRIKGPEAKKFAVSFLKVLVTLGPDIEGEEHQKNVKWMVGGLEHLLINNVNPHRGFWRKFMRLFAETLKAKTKSSYSKGYKSLPFPMLEWKQLTIKLKNTSRKTWGGWRLYAKTKKDKKFEEIPLTDFRTKNGKRNIGFVNLKNGDITATFKVFVDICNHAGNSEGTPYNIDYDRKGFETLRRHISDLCTILKDYFKYEEERPIYYQGEKGKSFKGGYICKINIHQSYIQQSKQIEKKFTKQRDFTDFDSPNPKIQKSIRDNLGQVYNSDDLDE
jgi:hypothetical protein